MEGIYNSRNILNTSTAQQIPSMSYGLRSFAHARPSKMEMEIQSQSLGEENRIDSIGQIEWDWLRREWPSRDTWTYEKDSDSIPFPIIMRMANRIAQVTKRGIGNELVCHPDTVQYIDPRLEETTVTIHANVNCPKDKIIVFYKGNSSVIDSNHGLYEVDGEYYWMESDEVDGAANSKEYVQQLMLVGLPLKEEPPRSIPRRSLFSLFK